MFLRSRMLYWLSSPCACSLSKASALVPAAGWLRRSASASMSLQEQRECCLLQAQQNTEAQLECEPLIV